MQYQYASYPSTSGHMSSSLDALPAKSTRSADARTTKTRYHTKVNISTAVDFYNVF